MKSEEYAGLIFVILLIMLAAGVLVALFLSASILLEVLRLTR